MADQHLFFRDARGPLGWQRTANSPAIRALERAGVRGEQLLVALQELIDAKVLVSANYYVPTFEELDRDYHTLGAAYLNGRINVRWVMCAETRDALAARYDRTNYLHQQDHAEWPPRSAQPSPDELATAVRTMMERGRHWNGQDVLFGIPIRIDPAARRPVFEIISAVADG